MRQTVLSLAALAVPVALAPAALASDLKLAGQNNAVALIGSSVPVTLQGNPSLPALVFLDVSAGPVLFDGELLPLGFTGLAFQAASGATNGAGLFSVNLPVPNLPSLVGSTLFGLGVVIDPSDPNFLDFSNGVSLGFTNVPSTPTEIDLAGVPRSAFPHFSWVTSFREGDVLNVAVDPTVHPALVGQSVDIYVTANKSAAEWQSSATLVDVTNDGANTVLISGTGVAANRFAVDSGTLSGAAGASLGVGYDVIVDANQNGLLDSGDLIDGGDGAGLYICRDPSLPGPYAVTSTLYSGGTFLGQQLFYPSNVADLSNLPLVVVSHGNGHNYQWYGHIGNHLASYGYVVMSHQNNTVPGVATAATTTLTNTDYFLSNLNTIAGGVLLGKVDKSRMTWIGHSRGGEGVTIAYDRIFDGVFTPVNYTLSDIKLVSSMAPTDFLGATQSNPHGVNYHLWIAESDSDVNGCAQSDIAQPFHLFARATGQRQSITIYGAGHGNLHNNTTSSPFAAGPCLLGYPGTHAIMRGHILPLVEFNIRENPAAKDWLTRHYEDLSPQAVPQGTNPCVVVNLQYRDGNTPAKVVIDNFQNGATTAVASSGATISTNLVNHVVGRLDDPDTTFTANPAQPFNGMTYAGPTDSEAGAVVLFDTGADFFLRYNLLAPQQDWSSFQTLTARVTQVTRQPATTAELGDANFSLRLTDLDGDTSTIRVADLLQGIEEPYQRTSCGVGVGWQNQFETVRIDLQQFRADSPALDLSRIASVEFLFGPSHGSPIGFFGIDDIEVVQD